jgi:hypothetical protein
VEYFKYLGSTITNDARCTREIKSRIAMGKSTFSRKKTLHQQIGLQRRHLECSFLYGTETWTCGIVDEKCLESF